MDVLDLSIKIHNNSIMPVSLTTTKRTDLEISCATNDATRGRRQRSLLRPDDEKSIYAYTLSRSIMTILSRLVYESDRTRASFYFYIHTHTLSLSHV